MSGGQRAEREAGTGKNRSTKRCDEQKIQVSNWTAKKHTGSNNAKTGKQLLDPAQLLRVGRCGGALKGGLRRGGTYTNCIEHCYER